MSGLPPVLITSGKMLFLLIYDHFGIQIRSILCIGSLTSSGNLVPTKRGISLTEQQWETVLSRRNDVDKLIDLVRSNPAETEPPEDKEMVNDLFSCSC